MLCAGRQAMVERAVRCYRAQTYHPRQLVVFDNGAQQIEMVWLPDEIHVDARRFAGETIGALRNAANAACYGADILCHFDSDDWSHPARLTEQVALLQSSGKQCVGYRRALFWDTRPSAPAAWEYTAPSWMETYSIDAARCYWRAYWEARPLVDAPIADFAWWAADPGSFVGEVPPEPRMVCGIHGDNMSGSYRPDVMSKPEWRRAPEFDAYCALCTGADGGNIGAWNHGNTTTSRRRGLRRLRRR
jgi:hypothetical protein